MSADMMQFDMFDMQELLPAAVIITVTGILAAKFGPASPCYKISGKETSSVFQATKAKRIHLPSGH